MAKCYGCNAEPAPNPIVLTRTGNTQSYCDRCAEEVIAQGWGVRA